MYCELPEFRRCCFCLPLRRGILILAYINLVSCIAGTAFAIKYEGMIRIYSSFSELPYELDTTLFVMDAVANLVLIVGLHMKRELLTRIYYYFMIFSLSASVPLAIIDIALMDRIHFRIFAVFYYLFTTVINLYLLLLVRSLVRKLQVSSGHTFGNQLAEFVEGSPANPGQNTVTITIRDENADDAKAATQ